ncbi:tRNA uridine-5-carboxymethylaminomethyl(34) synthesis GTPase MnmE [Candidatus Margulisiibacteriota bacterium]
MFHVKHSLDDTITAIATPLGPGGVGVIRVSGPGAKNVLSPLFLSSNGSKIESHKMSPGWLVDPSSGEKIDRIMACYMMAPKTFTGEDVVEFHCHGSMAVVQKALNLTLGSGARLAQKGEFTKRAFLNGKIDLAQAEAVLDLVRTPTESGAGYAIKQLEGRLSDVVSGIKRSLIKMQAGLEVSIDFPEDVAELNYNQLIQQINGDIEAIAGLINSAQSGKIYRQGLATVIIGKPNVGKSSLLNALLKEERAIVTEEPGTTRDSIEEALSIKGIPLRVVDTAGMRQPKDRAEELGVNRAKEERDQACLILAVFDASEPIDELDQEVLKSIEGKRSVVVLNKVDLGLKAHISRKPEYKTSALYGDGIKELTDGIFAYIQAEISMPADSSVLINERHKECLARARESLLNAAETCVKGLAADIVAIDVKDAIMALGEVTGELVSEEVINAIFDQFCVGK